MKFAEPMPQSKFWVGKFAIVFVRSYTVGQKIFFRR
jgi:hypothetical protein